MLVAGLTGQFVEKITKIRLAELFKPDGEMFLLCLLCDCRQGRVGSASSVFCIAMHLLK